GRPLAKIFLRRSPRHSAADYWGCTIGDGRESRSGADQRASFVCANTTGEASSAPLLRSFSVPLCNWPSPRLRSATFLMPPLYPRECAVDPHAAVSPFAPALSKAEPEPCIERHVGELVASAASAVAEALREFQNGGLRTSTKIHGGDLICELYKLRQFMVGYWDFDRIAVEYGARVLQEQCGNDVDASTIEILIDGVMSILRTVVRAAVN